ncbi:oligopeptidase B [Pseudobacter ginsenosidimutans]|uniref:Proline-specific endopeptidase n=2 Tax=Pseudobacter ginsenosidimutans TaxID=661488 RepID=A0A4Q7N2L4_9BACT|nr:S9 family peptidase [Pseudobacter ginsenosidimutans]RZS75139.1 oligopeptidase B [Pseudobacter ginsenosidimutans]
MIKNLHKFLLIAPLIAGCNQNPSKMNQPYQWPENISTPTVEKKAKEFLMHGDKRVDEYYWLNERENPKVIDYLKAENAYVDTMMSGTKELQEKLFQEMKGRIKEKDESVPVMTNGYFYYNKYDEGKQYPIFCRKKESLDAPEEIMFDQNKMAEGHKYYSIGIIRISDNNELAAFTTDHVSRRLYNLQIKNLTTGEVYPETIPNVEGGSVVWAADNKTMFYILQDTTTLLGYQVYRHTLGTDPGNDVLMYEEKDDRYYLDIERTRSRKYVTIVSNMNEASTEYRLLDASNPTGAFKVFEPRKMDFQYHIDHAADGKFYILTDWDAPNFRVMTSEDGKTGKENWKELIPARKDVYIADFNTFKNHLVLTEVKDAMRQIRVINQTSKKDEYIAFDEKVYTAGQSSNPESNTDILRIVYTSMTTPYTVIDYNMDTKEKTVKKQTEVIGYKKEEYETDRIWATARDGVKVPVTLLYKKGMKKDGANPLLLMAYGSYGNSIFPGFNSTVISLVDRGFIYAIAHVRGGQEMGRTWYDNGHLLKKKNTFYDFIDCGEFLVKENYTNSKHLYANGGSAGGLLMGAVLNLAPELWNGVVAEVPFVDVITTMSDASIPLTTGEYKEWGNPADSSEYFYMKSYSPYDNVEAKNYPNILVTTGLHDSQVQYFEPAKWVAKLREFNKSKNIILFKTNMDAGHGGASGRFESLREDALIYAFLLALEGRAN